MFPGLKGGTVRLAASGRKLKAVMAASGLSGSVKIRQTFVSVFFLSGHLSG